ncbi:uncharacterized protein FRV6_16530 [Fusarium oxysporum]|uniref:Uncharacterized protein n=1 Tax=Fusarium oxysporum TaxID=5507 RepID=A0A2H3TUX0_FUSOX|nr:uncharacterized protein FRV6_16530 [Fusarium oxysporum]
MDEGPFLVDFRINNTSYVQALVDYGCLSQGIISKRLFHSLKLPRIPIEPRSLDQAAESHSKPIIDTITYMSIDVDGHQQERIFLTEGYTGDGLNISSLAEIDKALRPKQKGDPRKLHPQQYREALESFSRELADTLPPHRPVVDHTIELEKDENGNQKPIPWGPLCGTSREELLVLHKTLMGLLEKRFIRASYSPAAAPVLFVRKPGGGIQEEKVCSDTSTDKKLTKQRARRLSRFSEAAANVTGKSSPSFRGPKSTSSVKQYFRTMKQLLVFYYVSSSARDVIKPTEKQAGAMEEIISRLRQQDEERGEEDDPALKNGIRKLYMALICHLVFSQPFDYSSNLSALIWAAQTVLFEYACFMKEGKDAKISDLIGQLCQNYSHQMAESPFGHILQWRLYLRAASSDAQVEGQARWSLDGQTIEYRGTKLHMEQVSHLVASEFRQAHSLIYNELLFGSRDIAPVEAWRLIHRDIGRAVDRFGQSARLLIMTSGRAAKFFSVGFWIY